jgi:type IV secretory pathway VirD2 relaxase
LEKRLVAEALNDKLKSDGDAAIDELDKAQQTLEENDGQILALKDQLEFVKADTIKKKINEKIASLNESSKKAKETIKTK